MKTVFNIFLGGLGIYLIYRLYNYIKSSLNNFDFSIAFGSGLLEVVKAISGQITPMDVDIELKNKNNFSIPIKNLSAEIFYNGVSFAKSTRPQDNFTIPANGNVKFTHNITVAISDATKPALSRLLAGETVEFTYRLKGKIGFFPFWWNDKFTEKL